MDDLISRKALHDALTALKGVGGCYLWDPEKVLAAVEKAPSAVVRCEECKYWEADGKDGEPCCRHPDQDCEFCSDCWLSTEPDGFCYRGERRAEDGK